MHRRYELEEVVRAWVEKVLPGQATIADQAVMLVNESYESGASVVAACGQVSEFVKCRAQHPGYQRTDGHAIALVAS